MVTQDLLNYIKQQIALGNTKESIINNLKNVGWGDNDIQEAFNILNNNAVVNNNFSQANSTVGSSNVVDNNSYATALYQNTNAVSKPSMQSILGLTFSVLSLIIFIFNFVSSFFIQNSLNPNDPLSSLNNPFLVVLVILGCLVPIFALIGLVLSLLSLKKSKLSIFGLIISVLVLLIQLISFIYGFVVGFANGFTAAFNNRINQNDTTLSPTTTPSPTKTSNSTNTPNTPTNTPSFSPTPSSYFKTQQEKSDYINKLVVQEKALVMLPKDYGDGLVLTDIVGTANGIQYYYEIQDSSVNYDYNEGYSNLKGSICSSKQFLDRYLAKGLTVEYIYLFKVDSRKMSFVFYDGVCN